LVVTNVLWFTAIDRVGPSRASMFANLQFFLAAVFGVILLSETITPLQVAGGVTIGAAILLSRVPRARAPAPQPVE
jgi:drug/metabolite transporter (DMT)-like permease